MAAIPPMTETEEKLRGIGVTMDQRKRLMMASKLGLGPLGSLGLSDQKDDTSRSRSPPLSRATPASNAVSGVLALAPGGHMVPAQLAESLKKRNAEQAARAHAISTGGMAVKAMVSAAVKAREDAEDLDSFLSGGRKMAVQAAKVMDEKKKVKLLLDPSAGSLPDSGSEAKKSREERPQHDQEEVDHHRGEKEETQKPTQDKDETQQQDLQREMQRRIDEEIQRKREQEQLLKKQGEEDSTTRHCKNAEDDEGRTTDGDGGFSEAVAKRGELGQVSNDVKDLSNAVLKPAVDLMQGSSPAVMAPLSGTSATAPESTASPSSGAGAAVPVSVPAVPAAGEGNQGTTAMNSANPMMQPMDQMMGNNMMGNNMMGNSMMGSPMMGNPMMMGNNMMGNPMMGNPMMNMMMNPMMMGMSQMMMGMPAMMGACCGMPACGGCMMPGMPCMSMPGSMPSGNPCGCLAEAEKKLCAL